MSKILKGHLNFKLRDSPFDTSEKYQPAYGNVPATLLLLAGRLVTSLSDTVIMDPAYTHFWDCLKDAPVGHLYKFPRVLNSKITNSKIRGEAALAGNFSQRCIL
jgi:hypothetical protein